MHGPDAGWANTTHDWSVGVDRGHLDAVRGDPAGYAPDGLLHLVLEVIAYADDEARSLGREGRCMVRVHADGSVSVADDGRGTDTRCDRDGNPVRKPVMATPDLRFSDTEHDVLLPGGRRRRGISVVAALSRWLVHTNHRRDGAWIQRYEHGLPVSDLVPIATSSHTGTTVRFLPDPDLVPRRGLTRDDVRTMAGFDSLTVEVRTS